VLKELTGVPAGIQALEAVGTVTTDDYKRVFAPLVDQARRTGSRMRLLYQFGPGFKRITPGALCADTRLGLGYLRLLDGCAVVSDLGWIQVPARGIGAWMPCPVRVYVGLLLDTLIVRTLLMPSIATLLGRWFWWPQVVHRRGAPRQAASSPARGPKAEVTTQPLGPGAMNLGERQ
jgi:hypothetical protein